MSAPSRIPAPAASELSKSSANTPSVGTAAAAKPLAAAASSATTVPPSAASALVLEEDASEAELRSAVAQLRARAQQLLERVQRILAFTEPPNKPKAPAPQKQPSPHKAAAKAAKLAAAATTTTTTAASVSTSAATTNAVAATISSPPTASVPEPAAAVSGDSKVALPTETPIARIPQSAVAGDQKTTATNVAAFLAPTVTAVDAAADPLAAPVSGTTSAAAVAAAAAAGGMARLRPGVSINGLSKLARKITTELEFLSSITERPSRANLTTSNVPFYAALIDTIESETDVIAISKTFTYTPGKGKAGSANGKSAGGGKAKAKTRTVEVDVVSVGGSQWTKVKAVSVKNLRMLANPKHGERSFFDAARDMCECSAQHPVHYAAPKCVVYFANGVFDRTASELAACGVTVTGPRIANPIEMQSDADGEGEGDDFDGIIDDGDGNERYDAEAGHQNADSDDEQPADRKVTAASASANAKANGKTADTKSAAAATAVAPSAMPHGATHALEPSRGVNLDVTSCLCLVSQLTNEPAPSDPAYTYGGDAFLIAMAAEEAAAPSLPPVRLFLRDRPLFICQTALEKFKGILDILGGQTEKERAAALLARATLIPDSPSPRAMALLNAKGSKLKRENVVIFGTGDHLKLVTLTANASFVRAARERGVEFSAFLHAARPLTACKQKLPAGAKMDCKTAPQPTAAAATTTTAATTAAAPK